MPTFSGLLRGHLKPSSRHSSGCGSCKTFPVALHEGKQVLPSPCHPGSAATAGKPRAQCRSNLPSALRSPLGPPPTPRGPFQTPWARGGCSGRKRWPRLGLGRGGSKQGGGGAPGMVSPATRRGRVRKDARFSRSTARVRQREPRDRSITGSHGALAFSSLRQAPLLSTRPRGVRGRRWSLYEGRRDLR